MSLSLPISRVTCGGGFDRAEFGPNLRFPALYSAKHEADLGRIEFVLDNKARNLRPFYPNERSPFGQLGSNRADEVLKWVWLNQESYSLTAKYPFMQL